MSKNFKWSLTKGLAVQGGVLGGILASSHSLSISYIPTDLSSHPSSVYSFSHYPFSSSFPPSSAIYGYWLTRIKWHAASLWSSSCGWCSSYIDIKGYFKMHCSVINQLSSYMVYDVTECVLTKSCTSIRLYLPCNRHSAASWDVSVSYVDTAARVAFGLPCTLILVLWASPSGQGWQWCRAVLHLVLQPSEWQAWLHEGRSPLLPLQAMNDSHWSQQERHILQGGTRAKSEKWW